jgi:polysaccharide export outer membrane protein
MTKHTQKFIQKQTQQRFHPAALDLNTQTREPTIVSSSGLRERGSRRQRRDVRCAVEPVLVAALVLCTLSGCRSAPYVWVHDLPREARAAGARKVITLGDVIEIRVYGDDKVSTRGRVLGDGTMVMPLLGPVAVVGKKPEDVAAELEIALKRFISVPEVTVMIQEESQVTVAVIGEVKQAGVVALEAPATVIQALAKAGGMTEFADTSNIFVLRPLGNKTQRIRFTYAALVEADPSATGFHLKTGDSLVVE